MNPRLAALLAGSVLAAGAVVLVTLEPADVAELEAKAVDDPAIATLVRAACPDCDAHIDCWLLASGDLCRYGRRYGEGVGGVNADGSPALCVPDPDKDKPWPCTGPSADWPEQVKHLVEAGDAEKMIEVIEARPVKEAAKEEAPLEPTP